MTNKNYKFKWTGGLLVAAALIGGCGGAGSGLSGGNSTPTPLPDLVRATLTVIAGGIGGTGNIDGQGTAARFVSPNGVAVDGIGNIYVTDSYNSTIRRISSSGAVTTFAGTAGQVGSVDGTGAAARFSQAGGLTVDKAGYVYVGDGTTLRMITPAGVVTTLAGTGFASASVDGTGAAARFGNLTGLALDAAGNIYAADNFFYVVRKITPAGVATTVAGQAGVSGAVDGAAADARFNNVNGLVLDAAGNIYVSDASNTIRKIATDGTVSTLAGVAGPGAAIDGAGADARFSNPRGLAIDSAGKLYVADQNNQTIRMVTGAGVVSTIAGSAGVRGAADGKGTAASFYNPQALSFDSAGNLYVGDLANATVRKITPARDVTTIAGLVTSSSIADGSVSTAGFDLPMDVAPDSAGNLYVADRAAKTIRKITPAGVVSTFAGAPNVSGSADGTGSAARFSGPSRLTVDTAGNVYVSDVDDLGVNCFCASPHFHLIRKITPAGVVTTLAGKPGEFGLADGVGAAAKFYFPAGLATDSAGNVYVADSRNSAIRKITPAGVVSTVADTKNGLSRPEGVALDAAGSMYITDTQNNLIRKLTGAGVVFVLAGSTDGPGAVDGAGAAARFNGPTAVTVAANGAVFVTDTGNSLIRKIDTSGKVTTIVGKAGSKGITPGSLPGSIAEPHGLSIDSQGTLFFTSEKAVLKAQ